MLIIPAVDIKNGKCVRLSQGKMDTAIVYEEDPVNAALKWQKEGAQYLHIVDLDGAFKGEPVNFVIVKKMISALKIPAEIGGGIRNIETVKKYIDIGIDRVILGTQAALSLNLLNDIVNTYKNKIVVGIDASNGKVAIEGWAKITELLAIDLARTVTELGVDTIIYTDISKDGMLKGPNFAAIKEFAEKSKANIIASGGISSIEDIKQLGRIKGVTGAIVGKALYTGNINLKEALAAD